MDPHHVAHNTPAPISRWKWLKGKEVSYLTLPLLVAATLAEILILMIGVRYQQAVCVPAGMGVTFLGIGPIGAVMLSVELLKLPLAIWTASRKGWSKGFMMIVGLPLICVLTFQLVKDMAVYEMGTAMAPATALLEKATVEELKTTRLNEELATQLKDDGSVQKFVDAKQAEHDRKVAELTARQAAAKAELEDALKRNDAVRADAITLTDYQRKELAEVELRQTKLIQQFNADTEQLTKAIAELRVRREAELPRSAEWSAEEARIENAYKSRLNYYTNLKNTYDKKKAEYDAANFMQRRLLTEPVSPGVPPEREVNKLLKPTLLAELESQLSAKEAELVVVNSRRRESVAQVEADARRMREEFAQRSVSKREAADRKHEELLAAMATLVKEGSAEVARLDRELNEAVAKERATLNTQRPLETIRAELEQARRTADAYYEERLAKIEETQVQRIATTVEVARGLFLGEKPVSVKATAKERGDIYTDRISMVRIWVYPVFAFIVAFLPTLMVEIGFSTLFTEQSAQPPHRLGFLGRGLHRLYIRAGRQKILRAERLAAAATADLAARDLALAERDSRLRAATEMLAGAAERHTQELLAHDAAHREESQRRESAQDARLAAMSESLSQAVFEKDRLRDLQKDEVERQVQQRQGAWLERIAQLREELDSRQRSAESERTELMQEHHDKLLAMSTDCQAQVIQARREAADADLAAVEKIASLTRDLKDTVLAREAAEAQVKQQALAHEAQVKQQVQAYDARLAQLKEESARELEKAARDEARRAEHRQLDFANTLRQHDEDANHRLLQREQELNQAAQERLLEVTTAMEHDARRREADQERRFEGRAREVELRRTQQLRQVEESAQAHLKQREQQWETQTALLISEKQAQAEQELRRVEVEAKHRQESLVRESESRRRDELQQQELAFLARLGQQEQVLQARAEARVTEAQTRYLAELRTRDEDGERQTEARLRALEARLNREAQQKEEVLNQKFRQREQQLLTQADARHAELLAQAEQESHRREQEAALAKQQLVSQADARHAEVLAQLEQESRRREQDAARAKLRELELVAQLGAQAEALAQSQHDVRCLEQDAELAKQQFAAQSEARQAELLAQVEQANRRREQDAGRAKQREQELVAQAEAQAERAAQAEQEFQRREQEFAQVKQQQLAQAEARQAELLAQVELANRRREQDAGRAKQREQELLAQVEAQTERVVLAEQESHRREQDAALVKQQQLAQAEARQGELLAQVEQSNRRRELDAGRAKQREQELVVQLEARAEEVAQAELETRRREQEAALGKQQQLAQAEARQAELRAQFELELRRREQESSRMKAREQELLAQLGTQAESLKNAERKWEADAQLARTQAEALLAQAGKDRDEARKTASEATSKVQSLEEKLMEVSSLFAGWKGGPAK